MKKSINLVFLLLFVILSSSSWAADRNRMLVIVTGATAVNDIGSGCNASIKLMKKTCNYVGQELGMQVEYIELTGHNFTKAKIIDAIENVPTGVYQSILFFNTSHGFNYQDQRSGYTFFVAHPTKQGSMRSEDFNNYGISLEYEVLKPLMKKQAVKTLVFSESCNIVININTPERFNAMNVNAKKRLRELFQDGKTTLLACSSKYGQASWIHPDDGGIYTNALIHSLNDAISSSNQTNWRMVMASTKKYTTEYAQVNNIPGGQESQSRLIDTGLELNDGKQEKNKSQKKESHGYISSGISNLKKD